MKKDKSVSAYTKIWLHRHMNMWDEKDGYISFLIKNPPRIVKAGVYKINTRRSKARLESRRKSVSSTVPIRRFSRLRHNSFEEINKKAEISRLVNVLSNNALRAFNLWIKRKHP